MSLFSRLSKNIKRGLRSLAPIIAPALSFALPGLGGIIGSTVLSGFGGGRTPGIAPPQVARVVPGAGMIGRAARRAPDSALRKNVITPGPVRQQMSLFGALPGLIRAAPPVIARAGRLLTGRVATAGTAGVLLGQSFGGAGAGDGACPSGWHLNKQDGVGGPAGTYCVRNRRMNFGNARSARRSVRRLKGARKLLKDIEKMMPTRTTRRRAPGGHSAHLHHTGG